MSILLGCAGRNLCKPLSVLHSGPKLMQMQTRPLEGFGSVMQERVAHGYHAESMCLSVSV